MKEELTEETMQIGIKDFQFDEGSAPLVAICVNQDESFSIVFSRFLMSDQDAYIEVRKNLPEVFRELADNLEAKDGTTKEKN